MKATTEGARRPCPMCGAEPLDLGEGTDPRGAALERASCRGCGLQLVAEAGRPWRAIRG